MDRLMRFLEPATRDLPSEQARARCQGALLGLAVGNALGEPVEGLSAADIRARHPRGVAEIPAASAGREWNDDAAQAIELARSLLPGPLDPEEFRERLVTWYEEGGLGIGWQTRQVLSRDAAGASAVEVARAVWEESGHRAAGNGAVMRCAPATLRWRRDPLRLVAEAAASARVTHYDPRCVWSAVAVCAALAHALADTEPDWDELADALASAGAPSEVPDAVLASGGSLADLDVDVPPGTGYTIRTQAVGLWALRNAEDLEDGLLRVVNAGGDTDTNGAVAGALLGARFGPTAMPKRWLARLPDRVGLESLADRLWRAGHADDPSGPAKPTAPVLYLDIDGVLLQDVPSPDAGIEARSQPRRAADGAAEFLAWATDRFEVRWLTAWAPDGELAAGDALRLSRHLGVPESMLAAIRGRPWERTKLRGIDVSEPRRWWWVDDRADAEAREALGRLGLADRWIECRSDLRSDALAGVRERLGRLL